MHGERRPRQAAAVFNARSTEIGRRRYARMARGTVPRPGPARAAEPLFARALASTPVAAAASLRSGRAALAKREFAAPSTISSTPCSLDPKASIVHYPLGLAYRRLGRTAASRRAPAAARGVEVTPAGSADGGEWRGLLRGRSPKRRAASAALDAGDDRTAARPFRIPPWSRRPPTPPPRYKLGTVLSLAGDTPGAVPAVRGSAAPLARLRPGARQPGRAAGIERPPAQATEHLAAAVSHNPITSTRCCGSPRRCGRVARWS